MNEPMKRVLVVVMDGCGAGEAPDAAQFGDTDHPATVRHVWETQGGFNAPHLASIGFLAACGISDASPERRPDARWGRLRERSMGKDSVTGHWEMMGIVTETAFPTYPHGFPADLVAAFESRIGRAVLGNYPASGTAILKELGPEHVATGRPILYTSADSVWQIAAHEAVVPIEQLYAWCEIARELCVAPNNVQRIIARPFDGAAPDFRRTERRRDFPLTPPRNLIDAVGDVFGIGVIPELFGGRGFRPVRRTQSNAEHAEMLKVALQSDARFVFANFEDFDMLYGHRNDPRGFAQCLESFDRVLGELLGKLGSEDLLLITADHGNDPTSASTDHSREYVPVCVVGNELTGRGGAIGDRVGMAAIGMTVAHHLGIAWSCPTGDNLTEG